MKQVKDLKPNPGNPRKITDEKSEMLKRSLMEFGDLSGIVFNRQTQRLVGGHQRAKSLPSDAMVNLQCQYETPTRTGTVAEGHIVIDNERYVYREVDWDETREKAANIAANKHGGDWDLPQLSEWLLELDALNYDLNLTGFTAEELENIMAPVQKVDAQCDEDEVPEHVEPKTKRGDIYRLGKHRLMCGDSTSIDDVEKLMGGEKADMVFTDPPYLQDKVGGGYIGRQAIGHDLEKADLNDFDPDGLFSVLTVLDPESIYCFGSKKLILPYLSFYETSGRLWDLLAMCKKNPMPSKGNNWLPDIEWIFFSRKQGAYFDDQQDFESYFRAREIVIKPREFGHPTEKQVSFIEPYMKISSPKNGHVLDLFGGSGSTLIACEKANRRCSMMELSPNFCDVIVARWEKYTGKTAELLNG